MRNELEQMEQVDRYLDKAMDTQERATFEARLASEKDLQELVNDQQALREGIARLRLRVVAGNAHTHYVIWKLAPWMGIGLVVLITTAVLLLSNGTQEHERQRSAPQPQKTEAPAPVPEAAPAMIEADSMTSQASITTAEEPPEMITEQRKDRTPVQAEKVIVTKERVTIESSENDILPNTATIAPQPAFIGGDEALRNYLLDNLTYPEDPKNNELNGRVVVSFVVMADGSVKHVELARGSCKGCNEEALRVVKQMPKWIPGKLNGELRNIRMEIPIVFMQQVKMMN